MNGVGTRQVYGYEPEDYAPLPAIEPSGRHMVEGYRQEVMDGFQGDKPLYNPVGVGNHLLYNPRGLTFPLLVEPGTAAEFGPRGFEGFRSDPSAHRDRASG